MNFRNSKSASGYATKQPQGKWHFAPLNGGIWEKPVNDCKSENGINSGWSGSVLVSTEYSFGLLWSDLRALHLITSTLRNQLLAMHTFLCLFPPTGRHIYVCSQCSLCSLDFLCLPYKENSPSRDPNHVNNIKDILLNPANKPSDSVSSLSAPPSPPPLLLLHLLLFHCLNMTGAPPLII